MVCKTCFTAHTFARHTNRGPARHLIDTCLQAGMVHRMYGRVTRNTVWNTMCNSV